MGEFGFSYIGFLFLGMLFVPNLYWTGRKPKGYTSKGENRFLIWCERIGQASVTVLVLVYQDFNWKGWSPWALWLLGAWVLMLAYEMWWLRYFKSEKTLQDFYSSFLGVPLSGASLPVLAFLLLSIYGRVAVLAFAVIVLGIGHIGIHWQHAKELQQNQC